MELRAELTGRNGQKSQLRVRCEPEAELRGLVSGLVRLREQVSALLGPLVELETGAGDQAGLRGDEEAEDEEEDDEEENHINTKAGQDGPPCKRTKTQCC